MSLTIINRNGSGKLELIDLYGRGGLNATTGKDYVRDSLIFDLNAGDTNSYPGSGTTWTDLTGNGYNGTLVNGPTYSSTNGGSIVLDGSDDQITMSGLDLRRNFSLEIWTKFDNTSRANGFFGQGIAAANQSINIWQDTSTVEYRMYYNDYSVSSSPIAGVWYQYVLTYNHSSPYTKEVYRNGTLLGASGTQGQYAGTGTFYIGSIGGQFYLDGNIAIVRGYSKILSSTEVLRNFNGYKALYGVS